MRPPLALPHFISLFLILFGMGAEKLAAADPLLKKGDVIALVGGEDMVVASEYGYLEFLLDRALPGYHLRFRNLAWEGDTVFEQRRDLNFPTWEEQLDKIGATVVIAQFGQMECLAGQEKLPEFVAAYEKLLDRFSAGGKRRIVLIPPLALERGQAANIRQTTLPIDGVRQLVNLHYSAFTPSHKHPNPQSCKAYGGAVVALAAKLHASVIDAEKIEAFSQDVAMTRDGIHLDLIGEALAMTTVAGELLPAGSLVNGVPISQQGTEADALLQLIVAKNRLWFDYWRPQNWAFLAGDRTSQPSSRDYLDPSKRWFPPEREQFLPLIEAKEKEIDALAEKLAKP